KEGDAARAFAPGECEGVGAAQPHRTRVGTQEAAGDAGKRALPGGVGTDEADDLAGFDVQRKASHRFGHVRRVAVADGLDGQERCGHVRLRRSSTKSGAPTRAVTAPTGGSVPSPRKSSRAMASATMRKAAPPRAEAGSSTR